MPGTTQQPSLGPFRRWGWLLASICVLAAFLLGFIPEYLRANGLKNTLSTAQQAHRALLEQQRVNNLRGEIDQVFIETSRRNYGVASGVASSFFGDARTMLTETSDSSLKVSLQNVVAHRDNVIAGLAKADPAVLATVGKLVDDMNQQAPLNTSPGQ